VTFSSIPATYRDLVLVTEGTATNASYSLRFNGDSTVNYAIVNMRGNGSTAASSAATDDQISIDQSLPAIVQVLDYSATDKHKSVLSRANSAANTVWAIAARYASTSSITTINLQNMSNFGAGSTLSLYGIAA
jgi:hypothetical protein